MFIHIGSNRVPLSEIIADVEAAKKKFNYESEFAFTTATVDGLIAAIERLERQSKLR